MQPSNPATNITPYENQAREAALQWSQQAISTNGPAFDILSSRQHGMAGTIVASHHLTVKHQIRRWCGRVVAGSNDIVCDTRENFDEGLKHQGFLALYNEAAQNDLTESITGAPYSAFRSVSYRPVRTQRVLYPQQCDHCHASGTQTCPNCSGARETRCGHCDGAGDETCSACAGSGQVLAGYTDSDGNYHDDYQDCSTCGGRRHIHCYSCSGSGSESCADCHRTGTVSCSSCEGTGSFTEIGQIALVHTPEYRVTFDNGSPSTSHHVLNFFGHAGFADQATVQLDSVNRIDDTQTTTTLAFTYRFQLSAALIKMKTRQYVLGPGDHSEWTVVGKRPEVVDCDHALFPLLLGASIPLKQATRWRSLLQWGYNRRVSGELNDLLKHSVHQWIVEASAQNYSAEAIEIWTRRALDSLSIAAVVNNVTRALKTTYRRRLLLHQSAAMLITMLCLLVTSDAAHQYALLLLAASPRHSFWLSVTSSVETLAGYGAPSIMLAAVASAVAFSLQRRHQIWLRRAGGEALWARAVSLGQLQLRSPCLQILGAMAAVALVPMIAHAVLPSQ